MSEASRLPQLSIKPATTPITVYTAIDAQQTDSAILNLFTYLLPYLICTSLLIHNEARSTEVSRLPHFFTPRDGK